MDTSELRTFIKILTSIEDCNHPQCKSIRQEAAKLLKDMDTSLKDERDIFEDSVSGLTKVLVGAELNKSKAIQKAVLEEREQCAKLTEELDKDIAELIRLRTSSRNQ